MPYLVLILALDVVLAVLLVYFTIILVISLCRSAVESWADRHRAPPKKA